MQRPTLRENLAPLGKLHTVREGWGLRKERSFEGLDHEQHECMSSVRHSPYSTLCHGSSPYNYDLVNQVKGLGIHPAVSGEIFKGVKPRVT